MQKPCLIVHLGKLRDVEVMCQENEATGGELVRKVGLMCQTFTMLITRFMQVLDILYQTEDGFAVPDEEDGVPPPPEEEEY